MFVGWRPPSYTSERNELSSLRWAEASTSLWGQLGSQLSEPPAMRGATGQRGLYTGCLLWVFVHGDGGWGRDMFPMKASNVGQWSDDHIGSLCLLCHLGKKIRCLQDKLNKTLPVLKGWAHSKPSKWWKIGVEDINKPCAEGNSGNECARCRCAWNTTGHHDFFFWF